MSLASDITEVLSEVGVSYDILKPDGATAASGFLDLMSHTEHTTPAIREHFITGTLSVTTEAKEGDVLLLSGGVKILITTLQPEYFENEIIDYLFASWVCNVEGKFQRHSDEPTYDADYEPVTQGWVDKSPVIPAAQIPAASARNQFQKIQDYFVIELNHEVLYVSDYYDVISGDRWYISENNYFAIEYVSETTMTGLKVCTLKFDAR